VSQTFNCLTTKEKIIRAAMDIITEEGLESMTIRKIAKRANVNVAAVNYHFGSKDTVINEALRNVTEQLKSTFEYLKNSSDNSEAKLSTFIENYTNIMFEYPDMIKSMINHAIHNKPLDRHAEYIAFIQTDGMALINQAIRQIRPDLDDCLLSLKTLQLLSAISFPVLMGDQFGFLMSIDLHNVEIRDRYTKLLVESICR